MSTYPKITVVTVCRNSVETIERTIQSVISQNYPNLEYIVIDGNSKDGTVDVIKKYESYIAYWLSEPDQGIFDAMNKAIRIATGELINFLNSDDWYAENVLFTIANAYRYSAADVIYGENVVIDEARTYIKSNHKDVVLSELYYRMPLAHQALFVRTCLQKKYEFDARYLVASDYKFFLQIYHDNRKFYYCDCIVGFFSYGGYSTKRYLYRSLREMHEIAKSFVEKEACLKSAYLKKIDDVYACRLEQLIEIRMKKYNFLRCWLQRNMSDVNGYWIFGMGNIGKRCFEALLDAGIYICGFLDNCEKTNLAWTRSRSYRPDILIGVRNTNILVASDKYEFEMYRQLVDMQLDVSVKIITYSHIRREIYASYLKLYRGN